MLPILILLTFGAIEYGLIYRDELRITTAARSGARIGVADRAASGLSINADDDWQILQAVYAALGNLGTKVVYVSIYNAASNGAPPPGCTGPGAASIANSCDVYGQSDFTLTAAQLEASSKYLWPVSARRLTLDAGNSQEPTYLGVEVETTHNYISGLFGSSRTILERSIFRFEPNGDTTHCNCIPLNPANTTTSTTGGATTTTTSTTIGGAGGGGSTTTSTTHAPTTTTTWAGTTTTFGGTTTTYAPTTTTTSGPTTTAAPTTTSTTSQIIVIPT